MLINFSVSNFRSFKEEQALSFVASKDTAHSETNLIPFDNTHLLKAIAIYGANASGKSNLITALDLVSRFIRNSATKMNQGDKIPGLTPFRLDRDSVEQPSRFRVDFSDEGVRYQYGFAATASQVQEEWLYAYPKGRQQCWLKRSLSDKADEEFDWHFGSVLRLKSQRELLRKNTRPNGLALSRAAELHMSPFTDIFNWFDKVWVFRMWESAELLMHKTASWAKDNPRALSRMQNLIRDADLGISKITIEETQFALRRDASDLEEVLSEKAMKFLQKISTFNVQSHHSVPNSENFVTFNFAEDESGGTQRFFSLLGPILDALDVGTVLAVDELSCSMHPLLTRTLIKLFQSPDVNQKGAQLIFTTHDSTLFDQELFRRDQLCLIEKNKLGSSELFSLYDFKQKPRTTEALQRNYLAGRYGGIPRFGPSLEDLEVK